MTYRYQIIIATIDFNNKNTFHFYIYFLGNSTNLFKNKLIDIEPNQMSVWQRDVYDLLESDKLTTRIKPNNICDPKTNSVTDEIFLLVVVFSAVENAEQRQAIRETWAKDQEEMQDVKVIFMLGNPANESLQPNVIKESEIHGDIFQESFMDTYANLTIKSVMLLKWFTNFCKGITVVTIFLVSSKFTLTIIVYKAVFFCFGYNNFKKHFFSSDFN